MLSNSIQIQPQSSCFFLTFPSQNFKKPSAVFASSAPKTCSSSTSIYASPLLPRLNKFDLKSSAAADIFLTEEDDLPPNHRKENLRVVVKPLEKPRVVLKFIWMQKDIGIALNQMIPGHGIIPLSPYYFWPRKDAWEELRLLLDTKPWISGLQKVHLLNQATDIINLWQASGAPL